MKITIISVSIFSLILRLLLCTSVYADAENETPIDVRYVDTEYANSENITDWFFPISPIQIYGFGAWGDGSFFIHYDDTINVYDNTGSYTHSLHLDSSENGAIKAKALSEDKLALLGYRENCYIVTDKQGEILESVTLSKEEKSDISSSFESVKNDFSLFASKTYTSASGDSTLTLKTPATITLPFLKSAHVRIYSDITGEQIILYDDGGIVFAKRALFVALLVSIFAIGFKFLLRRKKN